MSKASTGHFFEDFYLGRTFVHATPRTVGEGDIALYLALTGSRHVIGCAAPVAHALGYPARRWMKCWCSISPSARPWRTFR